MFSHILLYINLPTCCHEKEPYEWKPKLQDHAIPPWISIACLYSFLSYLPLRVAVEETQRRAPTRVAGRTALLTADFKANILEREL